MKATIIFFSAFRSNLHAVTNASRSVLAAQWLAKKGLTFQQAVGSYKEEGAEQASEELSFVVPMQGDDLTISQQIKELTSFIFNDLEQDSFLAVSPVSQDATLVHSTAFQDSLGKFTEVEKEYALKQECYTHWQGKYFVCVV